MGKTNTADALKKMREQMFTVNTGDRIGLQNIGVLVTDGRSSDRLATFQEAATCHAAGIQVRSSDYLNVLDEKFFSVINIS